MANKHMKRRSNNVAGRMLLRREPKQFVGSVGGGATTAGSITHISAIAQGDGLGDRSGDKIFVEHVKFGVNILATATNNSRYIIFVDKFNTNTAPVVSDVLTSATVSALYNPLNVTQQKRFKILMDKRFSFSSNGELAATFQRQFNVNKPAYYLGSAATTFAAGTIWLLSITDVASSGAHDIRTGIVYSDF